MSIDTQERAWLSRDSYEDRAKNVGDPAGVTINGVQYAVLDTYSNWRTGYQGVAYQRKDTGEVVIAHRGTESIRDGVTDGRMVASGINDQLDDAMMFTQRAISKAHETESKFKHSIDISITGHSLGGTLAEITAAKYHLPAETFNAYGPASLTDLAKYGVDAHGSYPDIVNHVRATDVVGSASAHFGNTRTYATPEDISSLRNGRYLEPAGTWHLPTNPLLTADLSAHAISNFLPDHPGGSLLKPENEARARAYHQAIDHYRSDVMVDRLSLGILIQRSASPVPHLDLQDPSILLKAQVIDAGVTTGINKATQAVEHAGRQVKEGAEQAAHAVGQAYDATRDAVKRGAHELAEGAQMAKQQAKLVGRVMGEGLSDMAHTLSHPGSWFDHKPTPSVPPVSLDHASHPGNAMFRQCLDGVTKLNAQHDVAPSARDANFAGALAVAAKTHGLSRVDHVLLSDDASRAFAVQGRLQGGIEGIDRKLAQVNTLTALDMPLVQSSVQWLNAAQQREAGEQMRQTQQIVQQQAAPSPGR